LASTVADILANVVAACVRYRRIELSEIAFGGTILFMADDDLHFMQAAIDLAKAAAERGEIPVGAVIVRELDGQHLIVGTGGNQRQADSDPTAHAEIVALRQAGAALKRWQLTDCDLYVTLEPCPMCAGAMVNARIRRVIFGCRDPKAGAVTTLFRIADDPRLNHRLEITPDVLAEPCAELLKAFFKARRQSISE
jgi:tRNA(adenine34) deaminase